MALARPLPMPSAAAPPPVTIATFPSSPQLSGTSMLDTRPLLVRRHYPVRRTIRERAVSCGARQEPVTSGGPMNLLRPIERDVTVNGLKLHLLDWGGAGRTPLLLLHGFTGHAHAWDTLSIALQPHFHVVALDQRGHGDSDPADTYNAVVAFDDITGVVDQLGFAAFVLVGLS